MRYLKKFNESIEEKLYKKLITSKATEYIQDHEYEIISVSECRRILDIFKYKSLSSISSKPISFRFTFQRGDAFANKTSFVNLVETICKVTKFSDDYWLIDIEDCCFLCDTIEGIEAFASDLKNSSKYIWDFHLLMNEDISYIDDDYYSRVSEREYGDHIKKNGIVNFDKTEIKKIKRSVYRYRLKVETRRMILIQRISDRMRISKSYGEVVVASKGPRVEIRKLPDDYYSLLIRTHYDTGYFICDTFVGVEQILDKIKLPESDGVFSSYLSEIFK